MRCLGPILKTIRPHLSLKAKEKLHNFQSRPTSSFMSIVNGAQCHSSTLSDGTKIRLICREGQEEHNGVDIDLKYGQADKAGQPLIQICESWNSQPIIEMRVNLSLVDCHPHKMTNNAVGKCIRLPELLAPIKNLAVEHIEEHHQELVLHLKVEHTA